MTTMLSAQIGVDITKAAPKFDGPILLIYWGTEQCYDCLVMNNAASTSAVWVQPTRKALAYAWFKTADEAIKQADEYQLDVISISKQEPIKFKRTETEERIPQPDSVTKRLHYSAQP